jgi:predicted ATPase
MFSDITVKRHGRQMSDPFQLQVKVRTGPRANIMDVGYGVSQGLPILVDVRSQTHSVLLLQQPEVHLHPRAQAELASLFVASYKKNNNHFMIETHSDYIIDRIRILAKKRVIDPDDVSILYFAPERNAVRIHNISLDDNGDLEGVPDGYRDFFIRESDRLLGFTD